MKEICNWPPKRKYKLEKEVTSSLVFLGELRKCPVCHVRHMPARHPRKKSLELAEGAVRYWSWVQIHCALGTFLLEAAYSLVFIGLPLTAVENYGSVTYVPNPVIDDKSEPGESFHILENKSRKRLCEIKINTFPESAFSFLKQLNIS
jgi:hypothetical protein